MTDFQWGDSRRFYSNTLFLKQQFGGRVQKLALDVGFTCPNRNGTCGTGGCTYCLNAAFNPNYCAPVKSVREQLAEGMIFHRNRRSSKNIGYLAYFQAFSNTFASVEHLHKLYKEALSVPGIQGIVIATRPDCLQNPVLDLLQELSQQTFVALEIGIESCNDQTLNRVRRGHDMACTIQAIERAHQHHLTIGAHLIFGLPGETPKQWLQDVTLVNHLPIHSIKFHQLQIIKGTAMEQDFLTNPSDFYKMDIDEYIDFIVQYVERLRADIVIERFAAEVPPRYLAVTQWKKTRYDAILKAIEQTMEKRDTWQGRLFS